MPKQSVDALLEGVDQLIRALDAGVCGRMVGAILFGSHAARTPSPNSDIDLAIVVSNLDVDRSRQEIHRIVASQEFQAHRYSVSVESYSRLKEFLLAGDPFAWVVCARGRILRDRDGALEELRDWCQSGDVRLGSESVSAYLFQKSGQHYDNAVAAIRQVLSNVQLSVMAGAQAVAAMSEAKEVSGDALVSWADWDVLRESVAACATDSEIDAMDRLVMASKQAEKGSAFPGREVLDLLSVVGNVWKRTWASMDSGLGDG